MILSEFLKGRDVKINTVSNYISRNPDKFENHVTRDGKHTILDDEAIRILEEKYPIPTAFQAYTKYLDIKIGYEVHEKEK